MSFSSPRVGVRSLEALFPWVSWAHVSEVRGGNSSRGCFSFSFFGLHVSYFPMSFEFADYPLHGIKESLCWQVAQHPWPEETACQVSDSKHSEVRASFSMYVILKSWFLGWANAKLFVFRKFFLLIELIFLTPLFFMHAFSPSDTGYFGSTVSASKGIILKTSTFSVGIFPRR